MVSQSFFVPVHITKLIPTYLNFNIARLWVCVHDLPWGFSDNDWTVRILSHLGYVKRLDHLGPGLPLHLTFEHEWWSIYLNR